jgi:NAD(P)H-nitrite reductase large subunit
LKVAGIELFSMGQFQPLDGSYRCFEQTEGESYTRLICHDGRIVGANVVGAKDWINVLKTAIEEKRQLSELTTLHEWFPQLAARCQAQG